MFSMFGRTGAPTKMGPPHEDQKISATCQHTEIACVNIIINILFNNSSTISSRVAFLEPKLILITNTISHNFRKVGHKDSNYARQTFFLKRARFLDRLTILGTVGGSSRPIIVLGALGPHIFF